MWFLRKGLLDPLRWPLNVYAQMFLGTSEESLFELGLQPNNSYCVKADADVHTPTHTRSVCHYSQYTVSWEDEKSRIWFIQHCLVIFIARLGVFPQFKHFKNTLIICKGTNGNMFYSHAKSHLYKTIVSTLKQGFSKVLLLVFFPRSQVIPYDHKYFIFYIFFT